ncbi:conserved hypothetical protein [Bosea sp. 62]|nr:conserved hypothetical protein [Bosea sp. 21B]CAD5286722.1 conserved hypothetical protein [Bosea sp. 7B]CAD5301273.1 conserved hypothetical protein [Bosea sp. 46]VVT57372.1 hypothetical protein BOS5A_200063 [Bosea sp. EC-HK365B]VXB67246.1 conserved hypothetical protein [Bosea sp. 125]VXC69137.1 conserved hypothetical protein [Bosea sp. 62]VXC94923.1 conserved hypothetical protein [Bosea sp. 127]VXC95787.1 conserved hypothetical protein [Bosea sp. 29B]
MEPLSAGTQGRRTRHAAEQSRIRPARRDHGPDLLVLGGVQLQRPRHRQHGNPAHVRDARAARTLAEPAAQWRDPVMRRDHRAGCRLLRSDQPADHHHPRRRPLRHQRPQMVDDRGAAPQREVLHRHGPVRSAPRGRSAQAPQHDHRADGFARPQRDAQPAAAEPLFDRGPHRDRLHQCLCAGGEPARRGRRWLRAGAGAARAGTHPPLHALDRPMRGRARADGRARAGAKGLRPQPFRLRQCPGLDRRGADGDRPGPPALPARRLDDGQAWQQGRAHRGLGDQGRGDAAADEDRRPGDAGLRRRWALERYAARLHLQLGPGPALHRRAGRSPPAHHRPRRDQEAQGERAECVCGARGGAAVREAIKLNAGVGPVTHSDMARPLAETADRAGDAGFSVCEPSNDTPPDTTGSWAEPSASSDGPDYHGSVRPVSSAE